MPDRLTPLRRGAALALAGVVLATGIAWADAAGPAERKIRDGLAALSALLADPAHLDQAAPALLQASGLANATAPSDVARADPLPSATGTPVEAQPLDLRLALTMLTQIGGATDTKAVLAAQGGESALRALVIRKGNATLGDVARLLDQYHLQPAPQGDSLTLRVPLVIWQDASLSLGPGQSLRLSRADGAFLASFGHLSMNGAEIRALSDENPHLPSFSPFVTVAGNGSFHIRDSRFLGLGFGPTRAFGGFSVMRSNLMVARDRSFIRDSLFKWGVSVVISGASNVEIEGNRIENARGVGLIVANGARARIASNIFAGTTKFNAVQVIEGSVDAVIAGNVVLGGEKSGIVVRSKSHRPHLADNIVWHRTGGGITVDMSDCATILSNMVLDNSQKGIEVRTSAGSLVRDNHLSANSSAGIWISAQSDAARTFVQHNVLRANRTGLATATAEQVVLSGNDFTGQFPRFLSGDVARQSGHIAADLTGQAPIVLTAKGVYDLPGALAPCARS